MLQSEALLAVPLLAEDAFRSLEVNDPLAVRLLAAMNIPSLDE